MQKAAASAALSVAVAVMAMAWPTLDPAYAIPILVACLAVMAWSGWGWWSGAWSITAPNWGVWDRRDRFRLFEAASLWEDIEPTMPMLWRAPKRFRRLDQAVATRQLTVIRDDLRETIEDAWDLANGKKPMANPYWVVLREDLLSYASSIGERPGFLFPRDRR